MQLMLSSRQVALVTKLAVMEGHGHVRTHARIRQRNGLDDAGRNVLLTPTSLDCVKPLTSMTKPAVNGYCLTKTSGAMI
jgi:hypothetical protein